jgi:hypothetical protein
VIGAIYRDAGDYFVALRLHGDGEAFDTMGPFDDELDAINAANRNAEDVIPMPAGAPLRFNADRLPSGGV